MIRSLANRIFQPRSLAGSQLLARGDVALFELSRRAAACGRAELLAKSAHAGHLRLPAEPLEVAEKFGKLQRLGIRNFRKMLHFGKIPKKFGQIWRKFSKLLAKIVKFWEKIAKKISNF